MRTASKKTLRQNLVVGASALAAIALIYVVTDQSSERWGAGERKADGALWRLNIATASAALIGLVATSLIGPLRQIRGQVNSLHIPLRRTIGVWTAAVAALHVIGGLSIHAEGWRIWVPFLRVLPGYGRLLDPYGVGYWLGLAAVGILLMLTVTSNNRALRRLGPRRWKALHRLSYPLVVLVMLHSISLQIGERRALVHVIPSQMVAGIAVASLVVRAHWLRTSRLATSPCDQAARVDDVPT